MSTAAAGEAGPGPGTATGTGAWQVYDDFRDPDDGRWEQRVIHDADGTPYPLCDGNARVSYRDGVREVRIERFSRQASRVQNLDNPKHLVVSAATFEIPDGGAASFRVDMSAEKLNSTGVDYRDGFTTFNIIDVEHKLILDVISTGPRIHALYELQAAPVGLVPQDESFLYVVDNAELGLDPRPGEWHSYEVTIDRGAGTITATVDGRRLFHTSSVPASPRLIKLGMGILTLWPLAADGASTSLRNQGMVARWRQPAVRLHEAGASSSMSGMGAA